MVKSINERHGNCKRSGRTKEYRTWAHMKGRCLNKKDNKFYCYGERGITVCDRWLLFDNFLKDMGMAPSKTHSIDRINNDGDYEPNNCRWATSKQQQSNKSKNVRLLFNGNDRTLAQWSDITGIPRPTLTYRLKKGYPTSVVLHVGSLRYFKGLKRKN